MITMNNSLELFYLNFPSEINRENLFSLILVECKKINRRRRKWAARNCLQFCTYSMPLEERKLILFLFLTPYWLLRKPCCFSKPGRIFHSFSEDRMHKSCPVKSTWLADTGYGQNSEKITVPEVCLFVCSQKHTHKWIAQSYNWSAQTQHKLQNYKTRLTKLPIGLLRMDFMTSIWHQELCCWIVRQRQLLSSRLQQW